MERDKKPLCGWQAGEAALCSIVTGILMKNISRGPQ
jgi:hypothetical protein